MNPQFISLVSSEFLSVHKSRSFTEIETTLWQLEVHIRETDRDLKFLYADQEKALVIAERIAKRLHEKVLRREDVVKDETLRFDKYKPGEYKLVWYKKVMHHGELAFVAMKDYVYVRDLTSTQVVLQPGVA